MKASTAVLMVLLLARFIAAVLILAVVTSVSLADLTVFENDPAGWKAAAGGPGAITTIDWDDIALAKGASTTIAANHYAGLFGSPQLSIDSGSGLYVGYPDGHLTNNNGFFGADFFAVSGSNVFSPDLPPSSPEGILTVTFSAPMTAIGVWFLDVEGDHAGTGLTTAGGSGRFSGNQGDNSQSFLGIVSGVPFSWVQIHMSSIPGGNGVGIDDVMYSPVPAPGAIVLGLVGLGAVGVWMRRYA